MTASIIDTLLNEGCLDAMELGEADRILDVGSGLGVFSGAMAGQNRTVLGIERDPEIRRQAAPHPRVQFRAGDAMTLPLSKDERGTFDVAVTRFVLESSPTPQTVVDQMATAVRPGGRVILIDDDHEALTLWPELPSFGTLWRHYRDAFDRGGGDAIIGRKLPQFLQSAGLSPTKTRTLNFGTSAGEPTFAAGVERLRAIFTATRADLPVPDAVLSAGEQELAAWAKRPDAVAWNVARYAEAVRPMPSR